ncbi:MAG: alpha-glucosidase C-terminal domain-containing protein [Anaerolineae bacterium]|nr:alpha-glucosidase C-terminal domain-containing protein [Anaerolineae bacterium]
MTTTSSWLQDAIFYEIYPQSFYDTNRDGIGDLPGIIEKLDYIQVLGVNAIWLNPCFESPFQDAGYDVSDYYRVAPRYGTNDDLKRLFDEARRRGIRVLLDLVPGHTSHLHPWFQASCRYQRNEYTDWYIWTDSGWTWEVPGLRLVGGYAERDGSYVTNFFYSQPALNYGFANPDPCHPWQQPVDAPGPQAVRRELRKIMAFWLDMGCSGFRVDMAGSLVKNDPGWRETAALWQEVRAWLDLEYPEAALVAEWSNPPVSIGAGFHMDFLLGFDSAGYQSLARKTSTGGKGSDPYGCSFFDPAGRGNIRQFVDEYQSHYEATKDQGLICLITGNHDIVPRLGDGRANDDMALYYLFLMTMPGAPFIYYGDEIGMRSLVGLPGKEGALGRAGARTPMQWNGGPNAGFSTAPAETLYLPIDPDPRRPNVADQEDDTASLLNRVRRLSALRHAHPALQAAGGFQVVYAEWGRYPFIYRRSAGDETILVAINPAAYPVEVSLPNLSTNATIETLYGLADPFTRSDDRWTIKMPGVSGGAYRFAYRLIE